MEEVRSYWQVAGIHHFCTYFGKPFKLPQFDPEELEQAFIVDIPDPPLPKWLQPSDNGNSDSEESEAAGNQDKDKKPQAIDSDAVANDNQVVAEDNNGAPVAGKIVKLENGNQVVKEEQDEGVGEDDDDEEEEDSPFNTGYKKTRGLNGNGGLNYSTLDDTEKDPDFQISSSNRYNNSNYSGYSLRQANQLQAREQDHQEQQQQQPQNDENKDLHLLVRLAISLLKPHFNTKITQSNWQTYLQRLVDYNWVELEHFPSPFRKSIITQDGVELEKQLKFNDLPLDDKIDLFYALCDYRLWCEDSSDALKDYSYDDLRLESIGKDSQGYEYWYFNGTRIFKEKKELSEDLTMRKRRIKELEHQLIEIEKNKILKEQEEKRKAELERLAAEAKEARQAAKRKQQEELERERQAKQKAQPPIAKKRKSNVPILPPRTGLRERRSSAASNANTAAPTNNTSSANHNHNDNSNQSSSTPTPTPTPTRSTSMRSCRLQQQSKQAEQEKQKQQQQQKSAQKSGRSSRFSKAATTIANADDGDGDTTETESNCDQQQHKQPQKKNTRGKAIMPEVPKRSPEEECKAELERLAISREDRLEAWSIACESLEEWEEFAVKYEKTKSINEKYLSNYVNEEIMPRIRSIYAKRAAEIRRKEKELLLSLTYASRRTSSRIISKRAQEEEDERKAKIQEAELRRRKAEAEQKLRQELEREMKEKKRLLALQQSEAKAMMLNENGGDATTNGVCASTAPSSAGPTSVCSEDGLETTESNGRYSLRQHRTNHNSNNHHKQSEVYHPPPIHDDDLLGDSDEFEGIIRPDKLSEFYEAIELVIDTVRTSKHSWPFVEAVPETVPGYYDLIQQPMDLKTIRTKIEFRQYKSLLELEKDFQLLVNNCEKFNGPKNVYTKMVYKLWKSFRKNVRLYLSRDLTMDEYETFMYPPAPPAPPEVEPIVEVQPQSPPNKPLIDAQPNPDEAIPQTKMEFEDVELDIQGQTLIMNNSIKNEEDVVMQDSMIATKNNLQFGMRPPSPICEEVIIESYDISCPDAEMFVCSAESPLPETTTTAVSPADAVPPTTDTNSTICKE